MKKILIPLFMAAMLSTTAITASANPWRPGNNEHEQPTSLVSNSTNFDNYEKSATDNSTWKFLSKLNDIRESTNDIQTLVENIKNSDVKTATKEFVVSDVQVMYKDISLTDSTSISTEGKNVDGTVKVYYDDGKSWVEFPINTPTRSDICPLSTNGNAYGFTLPLDKSDLLTNGATCMFGCEANGHLYASVLIGSGIDPTTVSGILGHSQVSTSLNIYSHAFAENRIKAFDAVADALDFTKRGSA